MYNYDSDTAGYFISKPAIDVIIENIDKYIESGGEGSTEFLKIRASLYTNLNRVEPVLQDIFKLSIKAFDDISDKDLMIILSKKTHSGDV
jgi:hypothetical protein